MIRKLLTIFASATLALVLTHRLEASSTVAEATPADDAALSPGLCVDAQVEVAALLAGDDKKTCADYGMYKSNERDKCDKECQGNRKTCEKRQRCGDGQCPPPGYCWKCVDHK